MKFTIECDMKDRWVPQFLGMLKAMEYCGRIGASRNVALYADGDGDFRPKFNWTDPLPMPAKPNNAEAAGQSPPDKGYLFDAG